MSKLNLFRHATDGVPYQPDQVIFNEGDSANDVMYVVQSGQVEVRQQGVLLATLGPGDVLGEMAFIDGGVRSATAVATTASVLVVVDKGRFGFMVQNTPHFAGQLMNVLVDRLRRKPRNSTSID